MTIKIQRTWRATITGLILAILPYGYGGLVPSEASGRSTSSPLRSPIVKAANEFQVDGVRLGMSPDEFRARFPDLMRFDALSDPTTGTIGIRVKSSPRTDGIDAVFRHGKLIEYYVWYSATLLETFGGLDGFLGRLKERLGPAENELEGDQLSKGESTGEFFWRIDEASFGLSISINSKRTVINVLDLSVAERDGDSVESRLSSGPRLAEPPWDSTIVEHNPTLDRDDLDLLLKVPHVRQDIDMCVPACASSIIRYYGENRSPSRLKALADSVTDDPDFVGTYFVDLVKGLEKIGYKWEEKYFRVTDKGFHAGLMEIIKSLEAGRPVMVDTNIPPVGHTVVVIGYHANRRKVTLLDPNVRSPGVREISIDEFRDTWHSLTAHIRGAIFTHPKK